MATPNCPLTQEHCDVLTKVLQSAKLGADLAKACMECDLPTQEFLDKFNAQAETARKLKAKFFPDQS